MHSISTHTQIMPSSMEHPSFFCVKDRLGFENARQVLTNPERLDMPNNNGYEFIARKLDKVAKKIYKELRAELYRSPEHNQRIASLEAAYISCSQLPILQGATPFEQMCAIDDWFSMHYPLIITQSLTFNLATSHGIVSATFKPAPNSVHVYSLMQMKLGVGAAAPQYYQDEKAKKFNSRTWDRSDPWQTNHEKFIYPLEALEMVRQPDFLACSILKGNAFEVNHLNQDERYGVKKDGHLLAEASVEFKDQRKLIWERELNKVRSAAHVVFKLYREGCQLSRPYEATNICSNTDYKNHNVAVTPYAILHALKEIVASEATRSRGENLLYQLLFKAFVVKIGVQSTPSLHKYIIRRLEAFEESN